ncbi:MAG TPA: hypothetical protein DCE42_26345 [Myxococcales bacterium]|nr:hypothetical protein [Deltaproteobacteria bacterium]MBU48663.1 hypothetical protein [Deltaproteobacteria bacterium]MBU49824.1 hypothetical protein [Deltaproteobacteria bacterium]HAA58311.1 hypothetical protein [Myxococcales bacterium]|tara:strand:- start:19525 stop:20574 length:1050 start_codon:yes stop_codon:yes gene_type:complete
MNQDEFEALLLDYMEDALDDTSAEDVQSRLEEEEAQAVAFERQLMVFAREQMETFEPSAAIDDAILKAARASTVQEESLLASLWKQLNMLSSFQPAIGFAMLLLVVGGFTLFTVQQQTLNAPRQKLANHKALDDDEVVKKTAAPLSKAKEAKRQGSSSPERQPVNKPSASVALPRKAPQKRSPQRYRKRPRRRAKYRRYARGRSKKFQQERAVRIRRTAPAPLFRVAPARRSRPRRRFIPPVAPPPSGGSTRSLGLDTSVQKHPKKASRGGGGANFNDAFSTRRSKYRQLRLALRRKQRAKAYTLASAILSSLPRSRRKAALQRIEKMSTQYAPTLTKTLLKRLRPLAR